MKVRSLDDSKRRYLRNSARAFAAGEQNENWLIGVTRASGVPATEATGLLEQELARSKRASAVRLLTLLRSR
jgi:hypothetical protein